MSQQDLSQNELFDLIEAVQSGELEPGHQKITEEVIKRGFVLEEEKQVIDDILYMADQEEISVITQLEEATESVTLQ